MMRKVKTTRVGISLKFWGAHLDQEIQQRLTSVYVVRPTSQLVRLINEKDRDQTTLRSLSALTSEGACTCLPITLCLLLYSLS